MKINEDLNILKQEPAGTQASKQAKKLGLQYVGFGRYENPKTGQITHIVQNDRLVPFNRAIKSNTFQQQGADDIGMYSEIKQPEFTELHQHLVNHYSPDKYHDKEIDAIQTFVSGGYADINDRLAALPAGISAKHIEPTGIGDDHSDLIGWMDSALKKSRAPRDMHVYFRLGADHKIEDFGEGKTFTMKTFRSGSINPSTVISASENNTPGPSGRNTVYLVQVKVRKNDRGLYAADYSDAPDEGEFIFPRNTKFAVKGKPQRLVGSDAASENLNLEIQYLDCEIKS